MPLWDDATTPYTGQQPSQDSSGLWGWLTSLFSPNRQPPATAATPPLQPEVSWNANPWANMSGVPASMQVAPPSMFTAANPQQQTLWQRASNPAGYMGMSLPQVPQAPQAAPPAATPSVLRPPPAAMMPPPPKPIPPPVVWGGNIPAPAGGSTGWGRYGGMGILPPGYGPINPPPSLMAPSPTASGISLTDTKSRNLSDAELEKMSKGDIAVAAARTDLTYGDRMAILARLGR